MRIFRVMIQTQYHLSARDDPSDFTVSPASDERLILIRNYAMLIYEIRDPSIAIGSDDYFQEPDERGKFLELLTTPIGHQQSFWSKRGFNANT